MTYSSYAGSMGTWPTFGYVSSTSGGDQASLSQTSTASCSTSATRRATRSRSTGPLIPAGRVSRRLRIASVTDGTSNTIAYGEHAHGLFSQTPDSNGITDFFDWNWWVSGNFGDTLFTTYFPLNPQKKLTTGYYEGGTFIQGDDMVTAASSFHPGGANFAFCDGSVRFVKESINSWSDDPDRSCRKASRSRLQPTPPAPGSIGVYQALSTRNGGEVISADSF